MNIKMIPVGPLQTNCYLVSCTLTQKGIIIDPGWSGEALYDLVQQEGISLNAILLTHAHFDHIAGAAALKQHSQAPIMAHPDTAPWLTQAKKHAQMWGFQIDNPPDIDEELEDKKIIELGDIRLEVLYTPGHAPGHVCFLERKARVIFDGDVLFNRGIGRTDLPGGDYTLLMHSIRDKLLTLPDDTTVYPGHGPSTTIGEERRRNPFLR